MESAVARTHETTGFCASRVSRKYAFARRPRDTRDEHGPAIHEGTAKLLGRDLTNFNCRFRAAGRLVTKKTTTFVRLTLT